MAKNRQNSYRGNGNGRYLKEQKEERDRLQEKAIQEALKKKPREKNSFCNIPSMFHGAFRNNPRAFRILDVGNYVSALADFVNLRDRIIRSPETWNPQGRAPKTMWRSFVKHLFVKYPIPDGWLDVFEDHVDDERRNAQGVIDRLLDRQVNWVILFPGMTVWTRNTILRVAQGESLFKILQEEDSMPIQMTRKMCQEAVRASSFNFNASIRRAQVLGCGGSAAMVREVLKADGNLGHPTWNKRNEEFILSFFQWFANQGMLDAAQVRPLWDYLSWRRHHDERDGKVFTLKGRTALSAMRDMEAWHNELSKTPVVKTEFEKSGYKPWSSQILVDPLRSLQKLQETHRNLMSVPAMAEAFQEIVETVKYGNKLTEEQVDLIVAHRPDIEIDSVSIQEILSSEELHKEGKELHHCVYSYSSSVKSGHTSIWSYKRNNKRTLTIEVSNGPGAIVQVRGLMNRKTTQVENRAVQQWASFAGLSVRYL